MNSHADKTTENKSQSIGNGVTQKQSNGESTFQFEDNQSEAIVQRKLHEMVNTSPQIIQKRAFHDMANNSPQAKQAAQLQAMADSYSAQRQRIVNNVQKSVTQAIHPVTQLASRGDLATIQLMKDKGNKLAAHVAEKWQIDPFDAKQFVAYCNNDQELNDWLDSYSYEDWETLQAVSPKEHDTEKIAKILDTNSKPKKKPAKPKASKKTPEELQIELSLAQETRREQERSAAKADRQLELNGFNLVPGPAVTGDPVLSVVWPTILSEYVNRINNNLSVSKKFSSEQLTTALDVWKNQTATLRGNLNVSYVSTFIEVQDKSQRADGGSNSVNLVKRTKQADFIVEINGYRINAHVDQS